MNDNNRTAEDLGYIKATITAHKENIDRFYSRLDKHMEEEDKRTKRIHVALISILVISLLDTTGLPVSEMISVFKALLV